MISAILDPAILALDGDRRLHAIQTEQKDAGGGNRVLW